MSDECIFRAATHGYAKILKRLIAAGGNVNASRKGSNPAIFFAKAGGHDEVVKLLLEAGAEDVPYPPVGMDLS